MGGARCDGFRERWSKPPFLPFWRASMWCCNSTYALVQTALVQDEALKRANARIEELQAQLGGDEQAQQPGSFLDNMRDAVLGRRDPRSSVPTVRSQAQSSSTAAPPPNPNAVGSPAFGSGGSFLGTAASTAAGVIGGAPAQQHPFDVRPACQPWRTGAERVRKRQQLRRYG